MKEDYFLVLSPSEWKDNAVSNMQISAELSKKNTVIYVETPGRRFPKLSEYKRVFSRLKRFFIRPTEESFTGLNPQNVIIYSPLAIPNHSNIIFRTLNTFFLTYQIKSILKKYNLEDFHIWTFSPYWLPVINKLKRKKLIFHCVDGLHTYDDSSSFKNDYLNLVKQSDLLFTPNSLIYNELKRENTNTFQIGHGVTEENLRSDRGDLKIPTELQECNSRILVYAGTLANWVDYDLLLNLADTIQDSTILLIGYVHALAPKEKVRKLLDHKNTLSVGYKDYQDLPRYFKFSSIGLVPYISNNEHIQYSTPTKFLDYFAFGLPVVTTNYPAAHDMDGLANIATNHEDFINNVVSLKLESQDELELKKKRIAFAENNTWSKQTMRMLKRF